VLLLDKPLNWSSFDAVNKIRYSFRYHLGFKKIKVGHAGTLDPLASGLLIICVGKATKLAESLMAEEKEYEGEFLFGETTPSYDAETLPDAHYPTEHLHLDLLRSLAAEMLGEQEQMPPIFSAKKVDGKRGYEEARKGNEMILKTARITILEFEILSFENNRARFRVKCSKGTYIRSIANDFGKKAGSGAYLSALRRTGSGHFRVENALDLEQTIAAISRFELPLESA
jgi:tRNA pseudouridine55 synthase